MRLELHATPQEVMRAVEALREFGQAWRIPEKALFPLTLALEECGSNIVNHALQRDARQKFRAAIEYTGTAVTVELRDRGPEFDPTRVCVADRTAEAEERRPGGWGIQLARRSVDEIHYRREAGENILRLTKRLVQAPGQAPTRARAKQTAENHNAHTDMPLEIQIQKGVSPSTGGAVTVKLTGSLDTATAPDLERQLAPVLAGQVKDLVFDLAQLKFISSAGLRVFSTARKQLKERGGQASFIHMQPQIQEVFEIMKSLPGVAIFKDVAELDRYLAARQRSHQENT